MGVAEKLKKNHEFKFRISKASIQDLQSAIENLKSQISWLSSIVVLLTIIGMGCGYQFSGSGGGVPKDIQAVWISPFVNVTKTKDVGIDREITSALKTEFRQKGGFRVADQLDDSDAILSGVVRSLETRVVSVNKNDEVLQYEVILVVDLSFRRRSPDELLWRTEGIRLVETYSGSRGAVVTTSSKFKRGTLNASDVPQFIDIQLTETLGGKARGELVEDMARQLHRMINERF
ncbi:MAG: LptE family protein [Candidatus Binatia bacterium]